MANSKNKYIDEEKPRFDDCVEGDTVSEGDTSDEEDNQVSKNNNLELPSGNSDCSCRTRGKKRRSLYTAIAIAAVVVTGAAIGGGVYGSRKNWDSASPSTVIDEEFAMTDILEIPTTENTQTNDNTDVAPLTEENDSAPDTKIIDSTPSMTEDENDSELFTSRNYRRE